MIVQFMWITLFHGLPNTYISVPLADVTALVILISHIDQTNDLIFGDEGALKGLHAAFWH